jgi:Tol biopolymer transport system component
MSEPPFSGPTPTLAGRTDDRLDSWKEIAAYLRRDVTTVQRWEKREGMPVHRHLHDRMGSVYAFRTELDAWVARRRLAQAGDGERARAETASRSPAAASEAAVPEVVRAPGPVAGPSRTWRPSARRPAPLWPGLAAAVALLAATIWFLDRRDAFWRSPIAEARFVKVTDFEGTEQAAAISRDGKFVAFLSDRDGRFDVWVTRIGTGQFYNLTRGAPRELVNPSVRTLGFSPDGTFVTFWWRAPGAPDAAIGTLAVPLLGGRPRSYLEDAAEFDWSPDGSRLVYHTAGAGDPMFVREAGQPDRHLYAAPAGVHSHFPLWSADEAFVYFVQGSVPDRMDIWRVRAGGGAPERVTHHEAHVSHPVFLDPRTLAYLAGDASGAGPWLHAIDVERRRPRRLSSGIERYTSLAASADGKRLVATQATTRPTLWRVPVGNGAVRMREGRRIPLTTGSGFLPRLGPDYLLYVVRNAASDSLWKLQGGAAAELWSAPEARVVGAPAVAADGRRVALSFRQGGRTALAVMNADGTGFRVLAGSLELSGSPALAPDGRSITSAAVDQGVPRLVSVPVDGGAPTPLVAEHSLDPAWSPDGTFVVFSGADIGASFPVRAATAAGGERSLPTLTLTRGARHLRFLPGRQALVFMRGETRHKDLWSMDLETGAERQLTELPPDFELRDFDLSPDGREAVLEQVQEQSDIVQLDLPRR